MIAIDTNIIMRLLTHDDETQYLKSRKLVENNQLFIPNTVILESEWVLRYAYEFDRIEISSAFCKLFGLPNVHTTDALALQQAIQWYESGLDFADALHLSQCQLIDQLFTFDKKFIRTAKGLGKCQVIGS